MEMITLNDDIKVFYVTAASFPQGIPEAHEKLHALVPVSANRKFFGISRPENGPIVYRAAAEELQPGEAEKLGLGTLILKKGNYISTEIKNYMKDLSAIDKTFKQLLSHRGIDPQGYCVEWYLNNKDIRCMVRLNG